MWLSDENGATAERVPLGFTFSFTCNQTSVSQGTLIQWDKGWDIPEAVGKDPCAMLQESIDAIKLPVEVAALANDSVGTLLSRAYTSQEPGSTLAGVIIGTGTNAAYIERLDNIPRLPKSESKQSQEFTILNTEWGGFDDDLRVLPVTSFDRALDAASIYPGQQQLEKRVSGMYLGELMRLVILHCHERDIFDMTLDDLSPCHRPYGLDSSFLSLLAKEATSESPSMFTAIEQVLSSKGTTLSDANILIQLSNAISTRSARLCGSALGAIIIQSGRLSPRQSGKRSIHVTSLQAHQDGSAEPRSPGRGCGILSRLIERLRKSIISLQEMKNTEKKPLHQGPEQRTVDIGVDGSLIEFYPSYEAHMRSSLRDIEEIGPEGERTVEMGLAKDGSGVGAALMANAASLA